MSTDNIITHRAAHLTAYQNGALAQRYRDRIAKARRLDEAAGGDGALSRAVAINYAKLLAYKDEYEVARLYSDPVFQAGIDETFSGKTSLSFHLAPPLFAKFDPDLGRPRKIKFGGWIMSVFRVLAALKPLRGTPLDIFGYGAERRRERKLIATYERGLDVIADYLRPDNYACAVAMASLPDQVRGFGPVKMAAIDKFERDWKKLEEQLQLPNTQPARAA